MLGVVQMWGALGREQRAPPTHPPIPAPASQLKQTQEEGVLEAQPGVPLRTCGEQVAPERKRRRREAGTLAAEVPCSRATW